MRHITMLLMSGVLATSLLAGCSDGNDGTLSADIPPLTPTPIHIPPPTQTPAPQPTWAPPFAEVTVGDFFFQSDHNGSRDPAVDTVTVNGNVIWTWATLNAFPHSVLSIGSPSFTSSGILTAGGSSYNYTFPTPGTYWYQSAVDGAKMTGRIVVVPALAM